MPVIVIEPPSPVVSVEDAKKHLRIDHSDDDVLIESLIAAATQWLDGPGGWLGRALGLQTLEARISGFGCYFERLALPYPPVIDVLSVRYLDADNAEQTVDPSNYVSREGEIWTKSSFVAPAVSRDPHPVAIRYRAGYGVSPDYDENTVPAPIKVAILMLVGQWMQNPEAAVTGSAEEMPYGVKLLLQPFRVYR